MRVCNACQTSKSIESFAKTGGKTGGLDKNGVPYRRRICYSCQSERSKQTGGEKFKLRRSLAVKKWRAEKIEAAVVQDCRASDKKKGFVGFDLDVTFVKELFSEGCQYCGESQLRMTLDRIDNSVGHVRSNVVPACIRCNYARGNMPYGAWLCLVPGLREAREKGLFGTWIGRLSSMGSVAA